MIVFVRRKTGHISILAWEMRGDASDRTLRRSSRPSKFNGGHSFLLFSPTAFGNSPRKVTGYPCMMHVTYDSMVQGHTAGQTRMRYRNRGCKGAQNRVGAYSLVGRWNTARAMGLGCALGELPVCFRWIGFEVGRTGRGRGRGREGKEDREIRKSCEMCTE